MEFLAFFLSREFLVFFLRVFPFFPKDFRGSATIKSPCFFWVVFPCRSQKKTRRRRSGWLPSSGKPECAKRFFCNVRNSFLRRLLVRSSAQILAQIFGAQIWQLENRYSRVTQKMRRKAAEKSAASKRPCSGGGGYPTLSLEQTARHAVAARPMYSR